MDPKTGAAGGGVSGVRGTFDTLLNAVLQYQTIRVNADATAAAAAAAAQAATLQTVEQPQNVNARPLTAAELLGLTGDQYTVPWYIPAGLLAATALTVYLIVR